MKHKKRRLGALLLALLLLLGGCAIQAPSTQEQLPDTDPQQTRIEALEAELNELKEKEESYKAQIDALETRILQLTTATAPKDPLTESVTFHYRAENGGAVITGYAGNVALLTVPDTLDGLPVIAIGEHAFERASLTAIILPEGITEIGWFAFYECQNLAGVTLPSTVREIGYAVFDGCPLLTLHCPADSYAERYAQSYAIPYTNT